MKKLFAYTLLILFTSMGAATFAHAAGSVYLTTSCQSDNNCPSGSSCDMSNAQASSGYGTCTQTSTSGTASAGGGTGTAAPASSASTASSNTGTNLSYTPLEPLPGVDYSAVTASGGLGTIVNVIFTILISVGALMAVLMLTIGGFQYMLSTSLPNKQQGLKRTQAAIWGIVLIAAIWLILHTINPALLNVNLDPCAGLPAGSCNVTAPAAQSVAQKTTGSTDPTTLYTDPTSCSNSGNVWINVSGTCIPPITTTIENWIKSSVSSQAGTETAFAGVVKDSATNVPLVLPSGATTNQINQLMASCTSSANAQGRSTSVETVVDDTSGTTDYECLAQ